MSGPLPLELALRVAGVGLLILGALHVAFWRAFEWSEDAKRLAPLNARVFVVHVLFIVFVLGALGLLLSLRPELLLVPSDLGRLLLYAAIAFFGARWIAQLLVFDRLMLGWRGGRIWSVGANGAWCAYVLVFVAALGHQLGWAEQWGRLATLPDLHRWQGWAQVVIGSTWILFGLVFKALNAVPRHQQIVARVLGAQLAAAVIVCVAIAECAMGLWMLSGLSLVACMALQTVALVTMNTIELRWARDLLLSPRAMVASNLCLLGLGWATALTV